MKRLIASDLHGSRFFCRKLLALYRQTGAQQLVLLGDIAYSGSYDPRYEYDPQGVIQLLNPLAREILWVEGNCDYGTQKLDPQFPMVPGYATATPPIIRPPWAPPKSFSPATPISPPGGGWGTSFAPTPARSPCPGAGRKTAACSMRTGASGG